MIEAIAAQQPPGTLESSGSWPALRSSVLDWLVGHSWRLRFLEEVLDGLCRRLRETGVPLDRATLHVRTLHPQFMGATLLWRVEAREVELRVIGREAMNEARFLNSPVRALYEGAEGIRQRLDIPAPPGRPEYGVYADLRAEGFVDYVALPMIFSDGRRHACSWATRRSGGFDTADLVRINDLLPVLQLVAETRVSRRIARTLLEVYVGKFAGARILAGEIERGSGTTLRAAIWTCDMRGFTMISETWPRDAVIECLNEYFDTMAVPVERHGGEILKFIGDAMLAVFPLEGPEACHRALQAAVEARDAMRALNGRRRAAGRNEIGYGIALHVGDVMYGNIGAASRLDFTVIGPAVNVAARLEGLSKELRRHVLLSGPFANMCGCSAEFLVSVGHYRLAGVARELEVFGLAQDD
jgi:adenylate cyclase